MAVMLAGGGKPHGRFTMLNAVLRPTSTLTRIKATTGKVASIPPRAPHRDVSFFSFLSKFRLLIMHVYVDEIYYVKLQPRYEDAYEEVCREYQQKLKDWHAAVDARDDHIQATQKVISCLFQLLASVCRLYFP